MITNNKSKNQLQQKRSILLYLTSSHLGGAERVAIDVAIFLKAKSQYDVILLIPENGPIEQFAKHHKLEVQILPFKGFEKLSRWYYE